MQIKSLFIIYQVQSSPAYTFPRSENVFMLQKKLIDCHFNRISLHLASTSASVVKICQKMLPGSRRS